MWHGHKGTTLLEASFTYLSLPWILFNSGIYLLTTTAPTLASRYVSKYDFKSLILTYTPEYFRWLDSMSLKNMSRLLFKGSVFIQIKPSSKSRTSISPLQTCVKLSRNCSVWYTGCLIQCIIRLNINSYIMYELQALQFFNKNVLGLEISKQL